MEKYIGTKMIQAEPAYRYWLESGEKIVVAHDDEKPQAVVVATAREDGYKVRYSDGYVSWSPKDVFEAAYRETDGMNFGLAIEAAKQGKRIARRGWNGKEQYVFLAKDLEFHTDADLSAHEGKEIFVHDALAFMGTHGVQIGWLASQADMLGEDWYIVE